jgi:phenylalanyl-tRNA synthetase beta chain
MGLGFSEVKSYPFLGSQALPHKEKRLLLRLKNPLSSESEYLKDDNLLNLLEIAQNNRTHSKKGRIFEIEKVYPREGEHFALTACLWGGNDPYHQLKGVLEALLAKIHLDYRFAPGKHPLLHPKKTANILRGSEILGTIGEAHPHIAQAYHLKNASLWEVNLEKLSEEAPSWGSYTPISKYPKVFEQFSFYLPYKVGIEPLMEQLRGCDRLVKEVKVEDIFEEKGKRSITLKIAFQSDRKELSSKEIKPTREKVKKVIRTAKGVLRG